MAESGSAEADDTGSGVTEIKWSEDFTDLNSFENGSGLPKVVKYEEISRGAGVGVGTSLPLGLKIYAEQPVLFYSRTCKRHVKARTIYHDREGPYYEVGQTLDIPDDFDGWFEIVPPDFGRGPFFRTIGQLAEAGSRKFFTRTHIRAIRIEEDADQNTDENGETKGEGGGQSFKERKIPAGSVLTVSGTFAAKWQTTAQTGLLKRKSKEWTTVEINYLKCLDIDDKEVLVPMSTRGKFNIIYEKGVKDGRAIYRMKDILTDLHLPLKVRMIYGKAPVVPCIFTGMLILKEQRKEDTIIASTILNQRNVLLELPVSTKCNVKTSTDEDDYENLRTYIDAKKLCTKFANSYGSLIKLTPEVDTNQQMIQHIPTEKRKTRDESLKTLDLITNISLTDDEPRDYFMESSDSDSIQSGEATPLGLGQMMELREIVLPRNSQSISSA
ncbi:uncharacterized protein LOC123546524 [Mercenaria mercenaria]|uniref:uncharacterized protein LOC123546524 n=1 Tax=Mercenaria mercenaria TaxID=6596 RepID=UPI00234F53AB|nr:uncharacterized protein LOC123546524 [Mercenaria mercenaria]